MKENFYSSVNLPTHPLPDPHARIRAFEYVGLSLELEGKNLGFRSCIFLGILTVGSHFEQQFFASFSPWRPLKVSIF